MSTNKNKPHILTDDQIKSALSRSGYLLEQRVEHYLQKQRYRILNENYFVDEETNKLREIDLVAEKESISVANDKRKFGGTLTYKLVCECENNPQPVVFFPSRAKVPYSEQGLIFSQIPYSFGPKEPTSTSLLWGDTAFYHRKIMQAHHLSHTEIAMQYCSFSPKDKNRPDSDWIASHQEDQHNTLTNLLKGSLFISQRDSDYYERNMNSFIGSYQIDLYYPVLILQNRLMVARENENKEITLEDRAHIIYMKNHRTQGSEHLLMIDVIQEKFLPQYMTMIQQEVHLMHSRILKNPYLESRIASWKKDYLNLKTEQFMNSQGPY